MFNFQTDYEKTIYENRTHFVAVRGKGANRIRKEFKTFFEVVDFARPFKDNRTMVYAVNELGSSAHITNL